MIIEKVVISNFKSIEFIRENLNPDLNILVGNNETGKSTLLEAINLCLTGIFHGKRISHEISPFLFNKGCVEKYLSELREGNNPEMPKISIELYFKDSPELADLKGINNIDNENVPGVHLDIEFDEEFTSEYQSYFSNPNEITSIPTEYFKPVWLSFANQPITKRSIPLNVTFVDTTTIRLQHGTDYYLQRIINDQLSTKEKTELALEYRKLRETFSQQDSIKLINKKLQEEKGSVSTKDLTVSIDTTSKSSWEANLTSYLDEIPFQFIGKGEQSALKMLLALERKGEVSDIILIEEPENHLSFSNMNQLISKIREKCSEKQLIISTHSAFVANKLGLEKLIIFGNAAETARLNELDESTHKYFKKLPGYDTLRFILSKKSILVEGPSDELIVQKAYMIENAGKLPIEGGIDVISVKGLSFKRFLEIAKLVKNMVTVVTDNDSDYQNYITNKYVDFVGDENIRICADADNDYPTLEPQIVKVNDLGVLNDILGRNEATKDDLINFMVKNKTECALKLFETEIPFIIPQYIQDAIK